ncbi:MAG: DNA primase large subunit PriL [Candidatus Bathyarchaeia archaeon]
MISEREASKYPFLKEAASLLEHLEIDLEDLTEQRYGPILDRGEERVIQAIRYGVVGEGLSDDLAELLSFPIAVMLVSMMRDPFLEKRYALAEAVRARRLLESEDEGRIAEIAIREFGWRIRVQRREMDDTIYSFELHFVDYLRNSSSFREDKWRLINRILTEGYVLLTKAEAVRLLQVEAEEFISRLSSRRVELNLPEPIMKRLERIKRILDESRSRLGELALPPEVIHEAFPPCIVHSYRTLTAGGRLSHTARFTPASFLVNIGMEPERIVQLFVSTSDFNEGLTRYQIEHISGLRGSRTRYTPPNCMTMRTHGICHNPDNLCGKVKHPLSYYRRKASELRKSSKMR